MILQGISVSLNDFIAFHRWINNRNCRAAPDKDTEHIRTTPAIVGLAFLVNHFKKPACRAFM